MNKDEAKEELRLLGRYVLDIPFVNKYSIDAIKDAARKTVELLKENDIAWNYIAEFTRQSERKITIRKDASLKSIEKKFKEIKKEYLYEFSSISFTERLPYNDF